MNNTNTNANANVFLHANTYVHWYLNSQTDINYKFANWINKVEKQIMSKLNLTLLDLPDEDYMIFFEEKKSPETVVNIIFKSNFIC